MKKIVEASEKTIDSLTKLAIDLWPDNEYEDLKNEYFSLLKSENHKVFLCIVDDLPIAFIQLSIRSDYVEGSESNPVGYVEGIFVNPNLRRQGISKELMIKGEEWVKEKGCKQIGSDIEYDNDTSYHFHMNIGFKEANRIICFIKDIE
ncbi:GCN5-related N-acetyltransferase [Alkaliphilus metalliredigens QYMF]|uniref:Aminoglycoside N(6')-acetyltransferase type 1 n=1 Tax=Alkaliphilus metalliredigens (strain QYMF) TaxID=293826 RepID=A6TQD4_ALKMQ|nr:aminoglycoside 6'-N-acetyltransferase [Alkaliphilus metalliredigens]ABR48402.1 GCN5-related N-acetyltransferase [Alkaliphilus metalliredigens QYMF]